MMLLTQNKKNYRWNVNLTDFDVLYPLVEKIKTKHPNYQLLLLYKLSNSLNIIHNIHLTYIILFKLLLFSLFCEICMYICNKNIPVWYLNKAYLCYH